MRIDEVVAVEAVASAPLARPTDAIPPFTPRLLPRVQVTAEIKARIGSLCDEGTSRGG